MTLEQKRTEQLYKVLLKQLNTKIIKNTCG